MSSIIHEGPAKEDKLNWNNKAAELDNFIILRHPPSSLLGRGKADVRFTYKNNEKSRIVYGPEEAVFDLCKNIISEKKNPAEAIKMQKAFIDNWQKSNATNVTVYKYVDKLFSKYIAEKFYFGKKHYVFGRNPFDLKPHQTHLGDAVDKTGRDVKEFAKIIDEKQSSVYHRVAGTRNISKNVALEYAEKLKCDPVDLMFNKLSIPVWGKVNLLKAVELEQPYDAGRIYTYYTEDKDMDQVIVPRDLYQEDIKAIKISALGSMYDNQVAFYYRATQKDEGCLNKLCVVGIKGDPDNEFDNDDQWYFGLYENVRGKANLINPDPFISNMENKYILQDCRPDIMAPIVAIINPAAIVDKTKMRSQIPAAALVREEERLLAAKAAIRQAQEYGEAQRDMAQNVKELNQQIQNIQEKIKEQVSDKPGVMEWVQREKETMKRFQDKILMKNVK